MKSAIVGHDLGEKEIKKLNTLTKYQTSASEKYLSEVKDKDVLRLLLGDFAIVDKAKTIEEFIVRLRKKEKKFLNKGWELNYNMRFKEGYENPLRYYLLLLGANNSDFIPKLE